MCKNTAIFYSRRSIYPPAGRERLSTTSDHWLTIAQTFGSQRKNVLTMLCVAFVEKLMRNAEFREASAYSCIHHSSGTLRGTVQNTPHVSQIVYPSKHPENHNRNQHPNCNAIKSSFVSWVWHCLNVFCTVQRRMLQNSDHNWFKTATPRQVRKNTCTARWFQWSMSILSMKSSTRGDVVNQSLSVMGWDLGVTVLCESYAYSVAYGMNSATLYPLFEQGGSTYNGHAKQTTYESFQQCTTDQWSVSFEHSKMQK